MGISFEDCTCTIGNEEDKPALEDVAVCDGCAVGGVFHLFAAAPEGVVAVALDQGTGLGVVDGGEAVFVIPGIDETEIVGEVAVQVVAVGFGGERDGGFGVGGTAEGIGEDGGEGIGADGNGDAGGDEGAV